MSRLPKGRFLPISLVLSLAISLAFALNLFSGNTITFLNNLFNNWFSSTHNHYYGGSEADPEKAPQNDAGEEEEPDFYIEPVFQIDLPDFDIAFNPTNTINPQIENAPNFNFEPNITPEINMDPDLSNTIDFDPSINWESFPQIQIQPDLGANPDLSLQIENGYSPNNGSSNQVVNSQIWHGLSTSPRRKDRQKVKSSPHEWELHLKVGDKGFIATKEPGEEFVIHPKSQEVSSDHEINKFHEFSEQADEILAIDAFRYKVVRIPEASTVIGIISIVPFWLFLKQNRA